MSWRYHQLDPDGLANLVKPVRNDNAKMKENDPEHRIKMRIEDLKELIEAREQCCRASNPDYDYRNSKDGQFYVQDLARLKSKLNMLQNGVSALLNEAGTGDEKGTRAGSGGANQAEGTGGSDTIHTITLASGASMIFPGKLTPADKIKLIEVLTSN